MVATLVLVGCTASATPVGDSVADQRADDAAISAPRESATAAIDPTPAAPQRRFTVVATGDPLLHEWWWYQAERDAAVTGRFPMDFGPGIASTQAITQSADLAIPVTVTAVARSVWVPSLS